MLGAIRKSFAKRQASLNEHARLSFGAALDRGGMRGLVRHSGVPSEKQKALHPQNSNAVRF